MEGLLNETLELNNLLTFEFVGDAIFAVLVSFIFGIMITWTYQKTYKGNTYSQSFVHTIVMMGVIISVIIVVIGSNIARAFSLAGALSIIRFRSAISDPKDVAFIFFAMGAGLAAGTGNYLIGFVFVGILCLLTYGLYKLNYGDRVIANKILKITIPENLNFEGIFDDIFQEHLEEYKLISVKTTNLGTMFEITYQITSSKENSDKLLIDAIRCRNANLRVAILMDQQGIYM
ncbi:DUF4956 domain-containing protein [Alkaliphilus peptidifermentans]|uniref:DUF4956 domain-containing protein n=1 Tax=Alkaliphilus peptidifermentans DSM 18978 TaxID=1120976 RepID=A0A1G5AEC1_9FIRM|nr:DUF4956 domain-containing protein [Alkaliphilus peptidifermentans]SCX76227.1 protein of unknown function [Alkaliphilus peptidifermentans DSM 18978]